MIVYLSLWVDISSLRYIVVLRELESEEDYADHYQRKTDTCYTAYA